MNTGKNKTYLSALVLIVLTAVVVVIGWKATQSRRESRSMGDGFKTSATVDETAPLGSFADFSQSEYNTQNTVEIQYSDDSDLATPQAGTTAQTSETAASAVSSTAVSSTVAPGPSTTDPTATIPPSTTAPRTSYVPSGSTVHDYSEGAQYAYAYAGFTPRMANLNIADKSMLLVNRNYMLPQDYAPQRAEAVKGSGVEMDVIAAPSYQRMYDAAQKDGITLTPLSGYRRISTQKTNFENKIQLYVDQGYDRAEATRQAARIILPPGTSEHNAGLAMDIISLDVDFEETRAFAWLQEHAQDYGFILRYPKDKESITEITYEPWHWRYVGVQNAKAIKKSGLCLEEYLNRR